MKGLSNAVRYGMYRMDKLNDAIDRNTKRGKYEEESNEAHITKVDEDGARMWSY